MGYHFGVVSKKNNNVFKQFRINGENVIGVEESEPFALKFTNVSSHPVQVRFSLDGTDILTGEEAKTSPTGKMFLVQAHEDLLLEAWPEDMKGGARFVFTTEEKSVAVNTHGNTLGIGLLAAAVFEEYPPPHIRPDNIWYSSYYGSVNNTSKGLQSNSTRRSLSSAKIGGSSASVPTSALVDKQMTGSNPFEPMESRLAVGAGEHVDQKLVKAAGLHNPVLAEVIQLRYLPKTKLEKMMSAAGSDAFPGDKNEPLINLLGVPRVQAIPAPEWRFV